MTLESSGTMSIGGTTTDRSINLELGRSATATSSLNETDLRTLANVSSGAISLSDFYGKTAVTLLWSVGLTQGNFTTTGYEAQGFSTYIGGGFGTATDTSCDLFGGSTTWSFFDTESAGTNTQFAVSGATSNSGWTNVKVYSGTSNTGTLLTNTFRTSCSYSNPSGSFATWTLLSDLTSSSGNLYLEFF